MDCRWLKQRIEREANNNDIKLYTFLENFTTTSTTTKKHVKPLLLTFALKCGHWHNLNKQLYQIKAA